VYRDTFGWSYSSDFMGFCSAAQATSAKSCQAEPETPAAVNCYNEAIDRQVIKNQLKRNNGTTPPQRRTESPASEAVI
jgi:hypothetical protein